MRTVAIGLIAAAAGAVLGAFAMHTAWAAYAEFRGESARFQYGAEQDFLASRALGRHDRLGAIVHSVNTADAYAEVGFRWLQRQRTMDGSISIIDVLTLYPEVRSALADMQPYEPDTLLESGARAAAAVRLERLGFPELAEREWQRAFAISEHSATETRGIGEALAPVIDHHPLFEAGEDAYLDSSTPAELSDALAVVRASHCPSCDE